MSLSGAEAASLFLIAARGDAVAQEAMGDALLAQGKPDDGAGLTGAMWFFRMATAAGSASAQWKLADTLIHIAAIYHRMESREPALSYLSEAMAILDQQATAGNVSADQCLADLLRDARTLGLSEAKDMAKEYGRGL